MKFVYSFSAVITSALWAAPMTHADIGVAGESFTYSESFNIASILKDFEDGKFEVGGNKTLTHNQADLFVEKNGFKFGLFSRLDGYSEYSADTAYLFWQDSNDLSISDGNYELDIDLQYWQSLGFNIGYKKTFFDKLGLGITTNFFETSDLYQGHAQGNVHFSELSGTDGSVGLNYAYDEDLIFNRDVEGASGFGTSIDVVADWRINSQFAVSIEVKDLWSKIEWDDAPSTILTLSSNRISRDENGLLQVSSALSGSHSNSSLDSKFKNRTKLIGRYDLSDKYAVEQDVLQFGAETFASSKMVYKMAAGHEIKASYEWNTNSLGVEYESKYFKTGFSTNDTQLDHANMLTMYAALKAVF